MLSYVTAGESHGKALYAIVTGLPAGLPIDRRLLDGALRRRQGGYGRSERQAIERDRAEILSGARGGRTTGNPVTLRIRNRAGGTFAPVVRPRPGHADLAGVLKFGHEADARDVLERSSARETAARVAAGALAAMLLREFGIDVHGYVVALGRVKFKSRAFSASLRDASPFHSLDPEADARAKREVDAAARRGDTIGGVVEVVASGAPPGLGSNAQAPERLDARLAAALLSIPAIKGMEIGMGFAAASRPGSRVHDAVRFDGGRIVRPTNRAGGTEGGMSNGEPLVVRAAMKPLSTLRKPLESVDLRTRARSDAHFERSDVTAVPAASVVCEAAVAFVVAQAMREKFGGDSLPEMHRNYDGYRGAIGPLWSR